MIPFIAVVSGATDHNRGERHHRKQQPYPAHYGKTHESHLRTEQPYQSHKHSRKAESYKKPCANRQQCRLRGLTAIEIGITVDERADIICLEVVFIYHIRVIEVLELVKSHLFHFYKETSIF